MLVCRCIIDFYIMSLKYTWLWLYWSVCLSRTLCNQTFYTSHDQVFLQMILFFIFFYSHVQPCISFFIIITHITQTKRFIHASTITLQNRWMAKHSIVLVWGEKRTLCYKWFVVSSFKKRLFCTVFYVITNALCMFHSFCLDVL